MSETTTVPDLRRLLSEAVSPLPWSNDAPFRRVIDGAGSTDHMAVVQADEVADAALIVAAVNALPQLLAAIEAVQELHQPWHWGEDGKAVVGSVDPNPDSDGYTRCICGSRNGTGLWPCLTAQALSGLTTGASS